MATNEYKKEIFARYTQQDRERYQFSTVWKNHIDRKNPLMLPGGARVSRRVKSAFSYPMNSLLMLLAMGDMKIMIIYEEDAQLAEALMLLLTEEPLAVHNDFHLKGMPTMGHLPTVTYTPELLRIAPRLCEFQQIKLLVEAAGLFSLPQLSFCDCEVETEDWTALRNLKCLCLKSNRKISSDLLLEVEHQQALDDQFCLEEIRIVDDMTNEASTTLANIRTNKLALVGHELVDTLVRKLRPGSGPTEIAVETEMVDFVYGVSDFHDHLKCNRVKSYVATFHSCFCVLIDCFCRSLTQARHLESIQVRFRRPEDVNEHWGAIFNVLISLPKLKDLTFELVSPNDAFNFDEYGWLRTLQRHLVHNVSLDITTKPAHPVLYKLNRENRSLRHMDSADHLSLTTVLHAGCTPRVLYRILRSRAAQLPCSL